MKRMPCLISLMILLLYPFLSYSQDTISYYQPEINKQIVYEIERKTYVTLNDNHLFTDRIQRKVLRLEYRTVPSDNKDYLVVNVVENVSHRPDIQPVHYVDYFYPDLKVGFHINADENFYEELFSTVEFHYEFDGEKRVVKLYNRAEVLLQVRDILKQKGFSDKLINKHTSYFNTRGIPEITRYLEKIFFYQDYGLKNFNEKTGTVNKKTFRQDSLVNRVFEKHDSIAGPVYMNFVYNASDLVLFRANETIVDTLKWPVAIHNRSYKEFLQEETIQMVSMKDIPEKKLYISGVIENVRNKKVSLGVLRDPFGTDLHIETAVLDENNSFSFEIDFAQAGMVHLQFGQTADARETPMITFYAEPGSQLNLKVDGEAYPKKVVFNGDYSLEADVVHKFLAAHNLCFGNIASSSLYGYLDVQQYEDFFNALTGLDDYLESFRNWGNSHTMDFISTEIRAQLLCICYYYIRRLESWQGIMFHSPADPDMEKIDPDFITGMFHDYKFYDSYNKFGIYSRLLTSRLLDYYFNKSRRIINMRHAGFFSFAVVQSEYEYHNDLPQQVEIARTVLAGHPLYNRLAALMRQEKMRIKADVSHETDYLNDNLENYLDLIQRRVNDPGFSQSISQMMSNFRLWQREDYVPKHKFFNVRGETVQLTDFLGRKPTIFYVTNNWGNERYFFDDLAKDNPNMNFVLIMEGSNFDEWTDYVERAEPYAYQLFWNNKSLNLIDIFKSDRRHFIVFDKDGKRIGFALNPVNAVNLIKQQLIDDDSNPDKSELIMIIGVLAGILACSLMVLMIWKFRARVQFRKELQKRRLRELELTAIRSQMNPHFLFNCLNSIQNLVQQNKGREAHLYLANFAGLIRKVLNNSEKEEVSLAEELEMVEQYLNLEKLRFHFDYQININEEVDIYNTSVPSMLLQPFAENAVTHGLQKKLADRQMRIDVRRKDDKGKYSNSIKGVLISIEDNGIGRIAAQKKDVCTNGMGTRLMQERLEILQMKNKERYWLNTSDLKENGTTGTKVEIFVPEEY